MPLPMMENILLIFLVQQRAANVRFYVEALAGNSAKTTSYFPEGAEHDVVIFRVSAPTSNLKDVVINEFMASNEKWTRRRGRRKGRLD